MDDSNAKVNSVDIGTEATVVTMTGTVTVGTQQVPVTTIADGVFTASQTCTVCLPFSVPAANIPGKIYTFTSVASNKVTMTEDADGLDANVPYIFVPDGNDNISTTGSIAVQIADNNSTKDGFTFKGIYQDHTFTDGEIATGIYGFAGNNAVEHYRLYKIYKGRHLLQFCCSVEKHLRNSHRKRQGAARTCQGLYKW